MFLRCQRMRKGRQSITLCHATRESNHWRPDIKPSVPRESIQQMQVLFQRTTVGYGGTSNGWKVDEHSWEAAIGRGAADDVPRENVIAIGKVRKTCERLKSTSNVGMAGCQPLYEQ
ncbi:hypothetical protein Cob_v011332 [Colletotrichum orbiculare MAFF 240422]|uniref:Uncharacterized protein n=1 Tax=Colletotrichum orbiculare (strain 104-T / ATCC 96160 / CBS 514.97 / LARS 414 / MAFF 240422) TaxID=1213857 RepID=A0A484FDP9_COLOR|nr:hypothetical protein Cob_v011332 [Colletotrichum orbiculare MAFF 240422]